MLAATSAVAQTCEAPTPTESLASALELIGTLELNSGIANSLMQPLTRVAAPGDLHRPLLDSTWA